MQEQPKNEEETKESKPVILATESKLVNEDTKFIFPPCKPLSKSIKHSNSSPIPEVQTLLDEEEKEETYSLTFA